MADNEQDKLVERITRTARSWAETLTSTGRAAATAIRARVAERVESMPGGRRRRVLIGGGVVLLLAVVLGIGITLATKPGAANQTLVELGLKESSLGEGLLVSGFIEAEEVDLAAEISGRVAELPFDEGDDVQTDDVVVQLSSPTLEAELAIARSLLLITESEQAILLEGARDEIEAQALAAEMAAQAGYDGAYAAWQDAIALRDNPQEINVQLAEAYTTYTVAQSQAQAAQSRYEDAARQQYLWNYEPFVFDLYPWLRPKNNPGVAGNQRAAGDLAWQAQEARDAAQAALGGAQGTLGAFYALRENPQALEAQVINAEAQYKAAEARLIEAQANLQMVVAGASEEELAAAQANVDQAAAAVQGLERQIAKLTIPAPTGGTVLDQTVLQGELAVPGVTLVTLANLDEVKLTVFVPEDQLDEVSIGQAVNVGVDSFPGRVFDGTVATIANEAEFTPRSVVTREERVSLVFAVEVRLPNPDHALKPGMPADAVFGAQG